MVLLKLLSTHNSIEFLFCSNNGTSHGKSVGYIIYVHISLTNKMVIVAIFIMDDKCQLKPMVDSAKLNTS
jgi:hypothetical protein